jgi:hypothetical protein
MTLSVVVHTTPIEVEFVSDLLWSLGVVAIEEHWDSDGIVRLQTSLGDDIEVVTAALNSWPVELRWTTLTVNEEVANTWREFARPTIIGERIVIAPVWCHRCGASVVPMWCNCGDSVEIGRAHV